MPKKSEINNVIWSYIGTFFVMGVNIFLLPLILHVLPNEELGLWYVYASVGSLISLVNFGFSPCIMRNIGHVWGGAQSLTVDDIDVQKGDNQINYELFNNVLRISKRIYIVLGLVVFILAASIGTFYIISVMDSINRVYALSSWLIYGIGLSLNMGFNYWISVLRGIRAVAESQKANIWAKIVQTIVSAAGLLMGFGLLALSSAYLLSGVVLRVYSRVNCKRYLNSDQINDKGRCKDNNIRKIIVSNAIKFGANSLSGQIVAQVFQIVSASCFGLAMSAKYGLTMQLLSIIFTIAAVIASAVLPEINICRINDNRKRQKELLAYSFVSQTIIGIIGIVIMVTMGPWILSLFSESNTILPLGMTIILSLCCLAENNRALFINYISTGNQFIFTKYVVLFSAVISVGALLCGFVFKMPFIVILVLRLFVECSYNGWKWMKYVLDELEITICDMFSISFICLKTRIGIFRG